MPPNITFAPSLAFNGMRHVQELEAWHDLAARRALYSTVALRSEPVRWLIFT